MDTRSTPEIVVAKKLHFEIPIYQRLFEWNKEKIEQLLDDLQVSFRENGDKAYYIGMLTSTYRDEAKGAPFVLVDGQQRFTVLMLIGIALRGIDSKWNNFIQWNGEPRLKFSARKRDDEYLSYRIESENGVSPSYTNDNMKGGIETIENYMRNRLEGISSKEFADYIYSKLSFFVSELPDSYKALDLNRYFETMNSTGKNLENHEILKVKMVKGLECVYTRMWNLVADMDRPLIRQRNKETEDSYRIRKIRAVQELKIGNYDFLLDEHYGISTINDFYNLETDEGNKDIKSIKEIGVSDKEPKRGYTSIGYRSMLTFSEFLLQTLYFLLSEEKRDAVMVDHFFDVTKLQTTFEVYKDSYHPEEFISQLFRLRILYDYYIIRILNDGSDYRMELNDENAEDKKILLMFESMLYVASSSKTYHYWMYPLLKFVDKDKMYPASVVFAELKKDDDNRYKFEDLIGNEENIRYGKINRYWFWRLDFYLWKNRESLYTNEYKEIAANYVFKRNRSIEHISPQRPNGDVPLEDEYLHRFGNLVMISGGLNSSLSNSSYNEKNGHIQDFINNPSKGTIESLSMLLIYSKDKKCWDIKDICENEKKMLQYLKQSYNSGPIK